jgi:hypothetical protein
VLEVRTPVCVDRGGVRPPVGSRGSLVQVQADRGSFCVVAVRVLAIGIAVGDAGEPIAVGVGLDDQLAPAVRRLESPSGERG